MERNRYEYLSLIDIPESRVCAADPESDEPVWSIRHVLKPRNERLPLSNARTQIIGGDAAGHISFPHETVWHQLCEDGGVWMSDYPIEQYQHRRMLEDMEGRILVGGLGLGVAATLLAQNEDVEEIVVVEKEAAVIHLVWKHLNFQTGARVEVVHEDLFDYLANLDADDCENDFDYAFFDIWQSDGLGTFFDTVVPLREAAAPFVYGRQQMIRCWNENVMRGQLYMSLHTTYNLANAKEVGFIEEAGKKLGEDKVQGMAEMASSFADLATPRQNKWWDWRCAYFEWVLKRQPDPDKAMLAAQHYAAIYGIPGWGKQWTACTTGSQAADMVLFGTIHTE